MRGPAIAALAVLLALPVAAQHAQHEGGGDVKAAPANVLVDVAASEVVAGHPVTFAFLLLDGTGGPLAHQDMRIRVAFAGTVLFEAPAATGHDYDGLNEVTVTFPSAGPWTAALLGADGKSRASLEGWALARPQEQAVAHLEGPPAATVGVAQEYRMWPADPDGRFVKHFYTLFEAWDGEGLALQAKLHGHNEGQVNQSVVQLAFPHAGRWLLRAHMFQAATYGPQIYSFSPLVTELAVDVAGEALPPSASGQELSWQVRNGTSPTALVATVDPSPEVGRGTPARLTVRAVSDHGLRSHIDFNGTLTDAAGRVLFQSDRLHESDGLLQVLLRPGVPGDYLWSTVAEGNGTRIDVPFRVAADPAPATADLLAETGPWTMGQPGGATLHLRDASGAPLAHSEVGLEVLDGQGRVQVVAKLHSHDGSIPFTVTPLQAGRHTLRLTPATLGQADVAIAVQDVPFDAAPGAPWPVQQKPEPVRADGADGVLPPLAWRAAGAVVVAGIGATATFAAWRRRGVLK